MAALTHQDLQPARNAWDEAADLVRGIVYYGILGIGFGVPVFALIYNFFR